MELRHLRYFLAVADTLNFSRAAERLRVAQPSLGRQVHDLEDELGFRLFERSTTKVQLTEAGRFFQQQIEKLLMQLDIAVTGGQQIAKGTTGSFRIGTDWNTARLFVTDAANELHQRHPGLAIDFVELPGYEHTQAVREQRIDVGFVSARLLTPRKDIDYRLLCSWPIRAILPVAHPLASQSEIRLRDLKAERWVTIREEEIPSFKILLLQILKPAQFPPKFGRSARSFEGLLALVGTGEGVALLPEIFLPPQPPGLRYVGTDCAPWEVCAVWSKDHANAHVAPFLEILQRLVGAATPGPVTSKPVPGRLVRPTRTVRAK